LHLSSAEIQESKVLGRKFKQASGKGLLVDLEESMFEVVEEAHREDPEEMSLGGLRDLEIFFSTLLLSRLLLLFFGALFFFPYVSFRASTLVLSGSDRRVGGCSG
jgi:hypothetical protein